MASGVSLAANANVTVGGSAELELSESSPVASTSQGLGPEQVTYDCPPETYYSLESIAVAYQRSFSQDGVTITFTDLIIEGDHSSQSFRGTITDEMVTVVATISDPNAFAFEGTREVVFPATTVPAGIRCTYSSGKVHNRVETASLPPVTVVLVGSGGTEPEIPEEPPVLTPSLPDGTTGELYDGQLTVTGGTAPYTIISVSGLPAGLSAQSDGTITGTPEESGTFTVDVTFQDATGVTGSGQITLVVQAAEIPQEPEEPEEPGEPTTSLFEPILSRLTDGQRSVAAAITVSCPRAGSNGSDRQFSTDCTNLVIDGDRDRQVAAFGEITPDELDTAARSAEGAMQASLNNIGSRLVALRAGATGLSVAGLSLNVDGKTVPAEVLAALAGEALRGGAAGDEEGILAGSRWGFFVNGTLGDLERDGNEDNVGFETDIRAVTAGVDYRFSPDLVAGLALSYQVGDSTLDDNGGSLDSDGVSASLYGTYFKDAFYLDGSLSVGRNDYDQVRRLDFDSGGGGRVQQEMSANYDGSQFGVGLRGGYNIYRDALTITPTLGVEYLKLDLDGFTETASSANTSGGGWSTTIESQDFTSVTSIVGLNLSYASSQSWGVIIPNAGVEWVHEFDGDSRVIRGFYTGDAERSVFEIPTEETDANYFNVNLGVTGVFDNGVSASLNYQQTLGYDDLDAYYINASVRFEF